MWKIEVPTSTEQFDGLWLNRYGQHFDTVNTTAGSWHFLIIECSVLKKQRPHKPLSVDM